MSHDGDHPDHAEPVDRRPIIVTLQLDTQTADFFGDLRRRYFPAALNITPAHLTLFHNLPGQAEHDIVRALARASRRPAFDIEISGLMRMGRGVAFRISSAELRDLRAGLATDFADWLTGQDKQRFKPHVTVQNKVSPAEAAGLFDHLSRDFRPFAGRAEGVQLWGYDRGPWIPKGAIAFDG